MKLKEIRSTVHIGDFKVDVVRVKNGVNGNPRYNCLVIDTLTDFVFDITGITTYGGTREAAELATNFVIKWREEH